MIALGGGAVETPSIREALRERATTVLVEVDVETAWERVAGSGRPLAPITAPSAITMGKVSGSTQ